MDKSLAKKYFYEKKLFKILRLIVRASIGFGFFSYIVLWSGVEIGTPFLVMGALMLWLVSYKTVRGKDYLQYSETVLNDDYLTNKFIDD